MNVAAEQMPLPLEPPRPMSVPVRADDPVSSQLAADELVTSGQRDVECQVVLEALRRYPGQTSRELAVSAQGLGMDALGQNRDEWRYTLARRLPDLEDVGLVRATVHAPSRRRPLRSVDPCLEPCRVSSKRVIRWCPC